MRLLRLPPTLGAALCSLLLVTATLQSRPAQETRQQRLTAHRSAETPAQLMQAKDVRHRKAGAVPEGAVRSALAQKARIAGKADIPGSAGVWSEHGKGNLDDGSGSFQAARVDNFAYDPEAKRLFLAGGTAGVWMSTAVDGDITTIGDRWVSVGETLPTQIVGGVGWSKAEGGTLIAASGEAVMGSSGYLGLGAYWSSDLGTTWHQASGFPDAALVFRVAVDEANPQYVYIASSKGLFRSSDAGRSYANVRLPTSADCAGVEDIASKCFYANYVTDVIVKVPGGITEESCDAKGCPVLAGVGFRTGSTATFQDGTPQAPGNGLYRSATGEVDSFAKLEVSATSPLLPVGFAPQERIGRIELTSAHGPDQDHNYVYAIVQDAILFNGGITGIEQLDALLGPLLILGFPSVFNGLYVSSNFGDSWVRMADTTEIIAPITGSEIALVGVIAGSGAGIQTWYNAWVAVDPTRADLLLGAPTRIGFGLEEVWQNRVPGVPLNGLSQIGPSDFEVIGTYFNLAGLFPSTTHPDQHAGIYLATGDGGVCLFAGNDGGVYKQCVAANGQMNNSGWGQGANTGMYSLLPYGLGVAKDETVWFGLQDNGSGLIDPKREFKMFQTLGGDGFYAEVDPDNSDVAYFETQNGGLTRTTNRGASTSDIAPTYTRVMFDNWFRMDPLDAQHMVTGAQEIYETKSASTVTGSSWVEVFNFGTNPDTGAIITTTTMEVLGTAVYVGGCGDCGASGNDTGFQNFLASNVQDGVERVPETAAGWHLAKREGLPNRYITSIAIDPADPKTIYVALGGYLSNLRPPGHYNDPNSNFGGGAIYKSTDAGESFVTASGDLPEAQASSVVLRGQQLIVATDVGVFISSDLSGSSWTGLGTGLPAVPVNMLRMKPKATPDEADKLFAATFGRHIWSYRFADPAGGSSSGGTSSGGSTSSGSSSGGSTSSGSSSGSGSSGGSTGSGSSSGGSSSGSGSGSGGTPGNEGRFGGGSLGGGLLGLLMLAALAGRRQRHGAR